MRCGFESLYQHQFVAEKNRLSMVATVDENIREISQYARFFKQLRNSQGECEDTLNKASIRLILLNSSSLDEFLRLRIVSSDDTL